VETSAEPVPLTLLDIDFDQETLALFLTPDSTHLALPAESCPAIAVDLRLDGFSFPRPLTQDLFTSAADRLGYPVTQILLDLEDDAPHGHIFLGGDALAVLDATIGDALAIHQSAQTPLLATPALIARYTAEDPTAKAAAPHPLALERPFRSPRARLAQNDNALVEMRVLGLVEATGELGVILVDLEERRAFPFFIGFCQAASINSTLNRLDAIEARSHTLFHNLLVTTRTSFEYARITELRESTYIGEIGLARRGQTLALDARPSDAIALALRSGAPIHIAQHLLESVGEDAGPYLDLFAAGKAIPPHFFRATGNFSAP
jgi:bifunctional DNase/RNase